MRTLGPEVRQAPRARSAQHLQDPGRQRGGGRPSPPARRVRLRAGRPAQVELMTGGGRAHRAHPEAAASWPSPDHGVDRGAGHEPDPGRSDRRGLRPGDHQQGADHAQGSGLRRDRPHPGALPVRRQAGRRPRHGPGYDYAGRVGPVPDREAPAQDWITKEWDINGEKATIAIRK